MPKSTSVPTLASTCIKTGKPTLSPGSGNNDETSDDNSASTLIEAPVTPEKPGAKRTKGLNRHDFPEGGGSGGAEAFRRKVK